jgi:rod shape determining protein RodA
MILSIPFSKLFSSRRSSRYTRIHGLPWLLLLDICAICTIGILTLYSAARGNMEPWAMKQIIHFGIGTFVMFFAAFTPIKYWLKFAYAFFILGITLLIATWKAGVEGGLGAQRWIDIGGFRFQPSEFMKLFLILALARYYHQMPFEKVKKLYKLFIPSILIMVSAFFIYKQPHLGGAIILLCISLFLLFAAGVRSSLFILGAIATLIAVPLGYEYVLKDYQKDRVNTFINPESDPKGKGYNAIQSLIAIGSGGFQGKGYMEGTQSQLNFVPEKHTDFIFTIIAEEFGFIGSLGIIGLYGLLILMGVKISIRCRSTFGKLVAIGITGMMSIHTFINIGMVSGILPIVGVPLPLLSYGGSSMLSTLLGLGMLMNSHVYSDAVLEGDV